MKFYIFNKTLLWLSFLQHNWLLRMNWNWYACWPVFILNAFEGIVFSHLLLRGHSGCFLGRNEDYLRRKLGSGRYTHIPVSQLITSEAPCCSGGLSGISPISLLLFTLNYYFNKPQIQFFQFSTNFNIPPNFLVKKIRIIIQKIFLWKQELLQKMIVAKAPYYFLIIFRLNEILSRYIRIRAERNEKQCFVFFWPDWPLKGTSY